MPRSVRPSLYIAAAFLCAFGLSACSGSRPQNTGTVDSGSSLGEPCQFDSDCEPPGAPEAICGTQGTCIAGCATSGCPTGNSCNSSSGHCAPHAADAGQHDAGTDAGNNDGGNSDAGAGDGGVGDGGTDAGNGTSPTLCAVCSSNADCQDNGLCISDPTHTYDYCTQDCTSTACPTGFLCTTDSTGSHHQCIPSGGACPNHGNDGGTDGGNDGGTIGTGGDGGTDPSNPSTNGNGNDQCGTCDMNNDCVTGSICVGSSGTGAMDGLCEKGCDPNNMLTLGPITVYTDCVTQACVGDLVGLSLSSALTDCGIDYSSCGSVSGTNATFCTPVLMCGSITTFP